MLKKFSALIIDEDPDLRSRLKQVLKAICHKAYVESTKDLLEAMAILDRDKAFDTIILPSLTEQDSLIKFIKKTSCLEVHKKSLLLVALKARNQNVTYISNLFLAGVRGFIFEPFNTDEISKLITSLLNDKAAPLPEEREEVSANLIISDSVRLLNNLSEKIYRGERGGYALKELKQTSVALEHLAKDLPDVFEDLMFKNFLDAEPLRKVSKVRGAKGKKKQAQHPGLVAAELMVQRAILAADLLSILKISETDLDNFLAQDAKVTPELATRLSLAFGNTESYWLKLQAQFDESQA